MRFRRGQIVAVTFLDHVQGDGKPLELVVFGRLLSIETNFLTVSSWTYADPNIHEDPTDGALTVFTIVRSAVQSIAVLTALRKPRKARRSGQRKS